MATMIEIADRDSEPQEPGLEMDMKRRARGPNPFLYIAALLGCMVFVRNLQKAGRRQSSARQDSLGADARPRARLSPRRSDPPRPRTLRIGKVPGASDDLAAILLQSPGGARCSRPATAAWQIAL